MPYHLLFLIPSKCKSNALCCRMYCGHVWSQYKKDTFRKQEVGYNHAFRRTNPIKYDITCSTSCMFVRNNVMRFNEIRRVNKSYFKQRVTKSNNLVVNHVYNLNKVISKIGKNYDRNETVFLTY